MERLFEPLSDSPDSKPAEVTGQIPDWLEGRLYRLGPAKWDFDGLTLNHWFDGCALLYRFTLRNGKVEIMSRFLDTESYKKITMVNRPVYTEFGTKSYPDPCKNVFSRYFSKLVPLEMTDNVIGNIYPISDEIYCASETCYLWKVNPETLEAKEKVDLKGYVSVNVASSHPHRCPDGTVYNLGASFMTGLKYHVFKLSPMSPDEEKNLGRKGYERASVLCTISSNWKTNFSYYHSFGLSEHYILFMEQPLLVNTIKMAASGVQGHSIKECFEWLPKEKTRFHLVERVSGKHQKIRYQTDALFALHHVNTYEEDGHIVADIIVFENADVFDKFYLKRLRMGEFDLTCQPQFKRFVLPMQTDGALKGENLVKLKYTTATAVKQDNGVIFLTPEAIGDQGFELPVINYPMCNTQKYKYVYGSGFFETGKFKNSLVKMDTMTGRTLVWKEKETMYPSEVSFVATPGGTEEDDGVLLSVVLDVNPDSPDFLLVLDAKDFKEMARIYVPSNLQLPPTIHGIFVKD